MNDGEKKKVCIKILTVFCHLWTKKKALLLLVLALLLNSVLMYHDAYFSAHSKDPEDCVYAYIFLACLALFIDMNTNQVPYG